MLTAAITAGQQLIASNEYDLYRDHGTDSSYKYLSFCRGTIAKR